MLRKVLLLKRKKTGKMDFIQPYDFVTVTKKHKKLREQGIERGDTLFVQGHKILPVSGKDPYLQKVYMSCHKVIDGHVQLPFVEGSDSALYVVDGMSLQKLSEEASAELSESLNADVEAYTGETNESPDSV